MAEQSIEEAAARVKEAAESRWYIEMDDADWHALDVVLAALSDQPIQGAESARAEEREWALAYGTPDNIDPDSVWLTRAGFIDYMKRRWGPYAEGYLRSEHAPAFQVVSRRKAGPWEPQGAEGTAQGEARDG